MTSHFIGLAAFRDKAIPLVDKLIQLCGRGIGRNRHRTILNVLLDKSV